MMSLIYKDIFRRLALLLVIALAAPAQAAMSATPPKTAVATFAGGCFWCVEHAFDDVPGVLTTTSGYIGGHTPNPTYEQVSSGRTGHTEAVQVVYDPAKVSYATLLDTFWRNIDPTQRDGQFCDHGSQYRSEIFFHDDEQRRAAEASKENLMKNKPFKGEIVTAISRTSGFYRAEEYHQDYYRKNPVRYKFYKNGCGRDARLKELWSAR